MRNTVLRWTRVFRFLPKWIFVSDPHAAKLVWPVHVARGRATQKLMCSCAAHDSDAAATVNSGGRGKSAPRWSRPTPEHGVSLTNVLKQGGSQRLASLQQHADELIGVSVAMEATPTCEVMREAALGLALQELEQIRRQPLPNDTSPAAAPPIIHVDWGAASGAFARTLQDVATDEGRSLLSRSFDILPAGPGVEFADMASPPADSWGLADGGVELMSGIANLTNGRDLPGFFWVCARLLRSGVGRLVLVQPLNFATDTLALRGVGEVSGLFTTRLLRLTDLPVRDKGDGPTRVVELVLVRTERAACVPARADAMIKGFQAPQRPLAAATSASASASNDAAAAAAAVVARAEETVRRLGRSFQHKLLGTAQTLPELAAEVLGALGAAQGVAAATAAAASAPESSAAHVGALHDRLLATVQVGGSGGAEQIVYALVLTSPLHGAARTVADRLCSQADAVADRRAAALVRYLRAAADDADAADAACATARRPCTLAVHFDAGSRRPPGSTEGLPAALERLVAACDGGASSGGAIPYALEVIEIWAAPPPPDDGPAAGGGDGGDGSGSCGVEWRVCTRHKAQALLLLLQATVGTYLDGGLGLHELLDARQGRKGRHA